MEKLFKRTLLLLVPAFFFFMTVSVSAEGKATTGFKGANEVYLEDKLEVVLYVDEVKDTTEDAGLAAFGGTLSYDKDKLGLVGFSSLGPFDVELVGDKLGGFGLDTIKSNTDIMKFTFKAKSLGETTISYSGSKQPDIDALPVNIAGTSKTVNIVKKPSTNNNLSSLSVEGYTINFDKNVTHYELSASSSTEVIKINATSEDATSTLRGIGEKTLNFGKNTFDIIVTAENGAIMTYSIDIYKDSDRSSNANLKNLIVNDGILRPAFKSDITHYKINIPNEVETLDIVPVLEDAKSMVSIANNNFFKTNIPKNVYITVRAENGNEKTYTIEVTKDDFVPSEISLESLIPSIGTLSPTFNPEVEEYSLEVPYNTEQITFTYNAGDEASVTVDGPEVLKVGEQNIYTINVKDETGAYRVYTVNVYRAENTDKEETKESKNLFMFSNSLNSISSIGSYLVNFILNIFK